MNLLNKFKSIFKSYDEAGVIQTDTSMTSDEKIGYLLNELIKELKASGRSIACPSIASDFGSISIYAQRIGSTDSFVEICNTSGWSFKAKPTFEEF
jgi:hypothetical protein